MNQTFQISGMTCEGCSNKVKFLLEAFPEITNANVNLSTGIIKVNSKNFIEEKVITKLIAEHPKYKLIASSSKNKLSPGILSVYFPLLLIFLFLISIAIWSSNYKTQLFMNYFMGGFFLTFSFFKLLDIKGFQKSFSKYDVIAKKIKLYGFMYPFIELSLGWLYLINFDTFFINTITIIVLGVGSVGVVNSVLKKETIKCACLGTAFNLPMSEVTIIENSIMIIMASFSLINCLF